MLYMIWVTSKLCLRKVFWWLGACFRVTSACGAELMPWKYRGNKLASRSNTMKARVSVRSFGPRVTAERTYLNVF